MPGAAAALTALWLTDLESPLNRAKMELIGIDLHFPKHYPKVYIF